MTSEQRPEESRVALQTSVQKTSPGRRNSKGKALCIGRIRLAMFEGQQRGQGSTEEGRVIARTLTFTLGEVGAAGEFEQRSNVL